MRWLGDVFEERQETRVNPECHQATVGCKDREFDLSVLVVISDVSLECCAEAELLVLLAGFLLPIVDQTPGQTKRGHSDLTIVYIAGGSSGRDASTSGSFAMGETAREGGRVDG